MAFRKFDPDEGMGQNLVKSSVARGIRAKIAEKYPYLEENEILDELLPKKEKMMVGKCANHLNVVINYEGKIYFYNFRDGPYLPTIRLVHMYPEMMPKLRVDRGAIKFVFSGANIMCPGLTSKGATIHDEVDEEEPVAIFAEGKEHALAIGLTKMSTADIVSKNKGIGVETIHYLNDGLWKKDVVS
mmetsp:Transcript_19632/g.66799  ORF Transcript_19632/g.66799 Transcript_19632/m.66799 type:complete len:186 (-) Transcript_19632:124-681(-)